MRPQITNFYSFDLHTETVQPKANLETWPHTNDCIHIGADVRNMPRKEVFFIRYARCSLFEMCSVANNACILPILTIAQNRSLWRLMSTGTFGDTHS